MKGLIKIKNRIGWIVIIAILLALSYAASKAHADSTPTNPILPGVEGNARKVVVRPAQRPTPSKPAPRIVRPNPASTPDLAVVLVRVSIANQKLVAVNQSGKVIRTCKVSTASSGLILPIGVVSSRPHNHLGTFSVLSKEKCHWSRSFGVPMYWALNFSGGHYIHQTSKRNYSRLGTPASAGCVRLSAADAKWLYDHTPVGAVVVVAM